MITEKKQAEVVVIHDKPTFTIREFPLCTVCNEPVWQYHEGPCRHIMHQDCANKECRVCLPTIENTVMSWVLWLLMGTTGAAHLLTKEYYLAILHAICPGYFYVFRISVVGLVCNLMGASSLFADYGDELVFVYACSHAYRPEFAIISMWITGFYYVPIPNIGKWTKAAEAVVSMTAMTAAITGLHFNAAMGTFLLSACAWYCLWSWPRLWDFHLGNCFGLLSLMGFSGLCLLIAGVIKNTFQTHVIVQIWILSRVFFRSRSMKNYFSPQQSQVIVYFAWQVIFTIYTNQLTYYKSIT